MAKMLDQSDIDHIENLIRKNDFSKAREMLKGFSSKNVPRKLIVKYANCANRLQLFKESVKILNPLIRGDQNLYGEPSEQETLEYAFVLRKIGAVEEALELLKTIDSGKFPKTLFYQANCLFSLWEYQAAIPLLKQCLSQLENDPQENYLKQIAQVNLLAAYVQSHQIEAAQNLLSKLQNSLVKSGSTLLLGNTYELETQIMIQSRDWKKAKEAIHSAMEMLPQSDTTSGLFAKKWLAILESLKNKIPSPRLEDVRRLATELQHWETLRECDTYQALTTNDPDLLTYVYYGTPYKFYRNRVRHLLSQDLSLPTSCHWNGKQLKEEPRRFHLVQGQENSHELKTGQALHRLLIALCEDFYKPLSSVSAFSKVYPDEYFSSTSLNRVHQLIKRLKSTFRQHQIPLSVEPLKSAYRLKFTEPYSILIPVQIPRLDKAVLEFEKLKEIIGTQPFSARQAREALNLSIGKTHKILSWALQQKKLSMSGTGNQILYEFISENQDQTYQAPPQAEPPK